MDRFYLYCWEKLDKFWITLAIWGRRMLRPSLSTIRSVLSPTKQEVAPKWIIGAAEGHNFAKTCTWAITSCLVSFSSSAAARKSMLLTFASISLICSSLMSKPSSWKKGRADYNGNSVIHYRLIPSFFRALENESVTAISTKR